jgi:MFS family permease
MQEVRMKKWSLTLKVFLIVLAIGVIYVLIRSIIRFSTGEIEIGMAVARFLIGSVIAAYVAGIAASITALVQDIRKKQKLSLTLKVFLIAFVVCVLLVPIATVLRVRIGQIPSNRAVMLFIIDNIIGILIAGIAAGITALVVAIKRLGE